MSFCGFIRSILNEDEDDGLADVRIDSRKAYQTLNSRLSSSGRISPPETGSKLDNFRMTYPKQRHTRSYGGRLSVYDTEESLYLLTYNEYMGNGWSLHLKHYFMRPDKTFFEVIEQLRLEGPDLSYRNIDFSTVEHYIDNNVDRSRMQYKLHDAIGEEGHHLLNDLISSDLNINIDLRDKKPNYDEEYEHPLVRTMKNITPRKKELEYSISAHKLLQAQQLQLSEQLKLGRQFQLEHKQSNRTSHNPLVKRLLLTKE